MSFGPGARLAAETHDEAAFVDKVTCDIHRQQQEHKHYYKDAGPEHDAHGECCLFTQICEMKGEREGRKYKSGINTFQTQKRAKKYKKETTDHLTD